MTNPHWTDFDGGTPLRCDKCGEQIGKTFGEMTPLMRQMIIARCMPCSTSEEADAITREASR